jgi:quinol monooxygenase YgiN
MTSTNCKRIVLALTLTVFLSGINAQQVTGQDMMVRIAELEIYPEYLKQYKEILKEEAAASIKKEAGVIAIFPMLNHTDPNQIRILEIYASKEAYQLHLETPHFKQYKSSTQKMVKTLNLVDMKTLDKQTMLQIFKKLP